MRICFLALLIVNIRKVLSLYNEESGIYIIQTDQDKFKILQLTDIEQRGATLITVDEKGFLEIAPYRLMDLSS